MKSAGEIMNILDSYDLTGSFRAAAELAGCSHHTVAAHVARRDAGGLSDRPAARAQLIDAFLPKVEEWVERSGGKIRADVAHEKLLALGYAGSERTTRRGRGGQGQLPGREGAGAPAVGDRAGDVAAVRLRRRADDRRVKTILFCAWLAWSRFRVVLPLRDKTMPSVFAALDVALRRIGGAPTYVLTDNEKTVTVEHIAGIPVRNRQMVAFARHYSVTVHTCQPADPRRRAARRQP